MPTRYSASDGELIKSQGRTAIKRPNPVYMVKSPEEFEVMTNEGLMAGKPGDFIVYDPISGHVWPCAESYVEQHYDIKDYAG